MLRFAQHDKPFMFTMTTLHVHGGGVLRLIVYMPLTEHDTPAKLRRLLGSRNTQTAMDQ